MPATSAFNAWEASGTSYHLFYSFSPCAAGKPGNRSTLRNADGVSFLRIPDTGRPGYDQAALLSPSNESEPMNVAISKSKYFSGLQCPKMLWTQYNNPNSIPKPDPAKLAIFETGHKVGDLAKGLFPRVRRVRVLISENRAGQKPPRGQPSLFHLAPRPRPVSMTRPSSFMAPSSRLIVGRLIPGHSA